jgi:hypothetical protein
MVGGVVIETLATAERVWVNVEDRTYGDRCAIYVERTAAAERIRPGDSLWWQGRDALWTPQENREMDPRYAAGGVDYDIRIPRIGYSGVRHPAAALVEKAYA